MSISDNLPHHDAQSGRLVDEIPLSEAWKQDANLQTLDLHCFGQCLLLSCLHGQKTYGV